MESFTCVPWKLGDIEDNVGFTLDLKQGTEIIRLRQRERGRHWYFNRGKECKRVFHGTDVDPAGESQSGAVLKETLAKGHIIEEGQWDSNRVCGR